jgi:hypothetical protein
LLPAVAGWKSFIIVSLPRSSFHVLPLRSALSAARRSRNGVGLARQLA